MITMLFARAFGLQALAFFMAACLMTARGYMKQTDKYVDAVKSHLVFAMICFVLMLVFLLLSYMT